MNQEKLFEELTNAGAETSEATALADFEKSLHKPLFERSFAVKHKNAAQVLARVEKAPRFDWRRLLVPLGLGVGSLSLVGASAFAAQSSLPGDPLYPLKRVTETVFDQLDPNFKNEMALRRSQEVKDLVNKSKSDALIKKSLDDYQKQAGEAQNKQDLERSRENLKKAEENASEKSKEEIKQVLDQGSVQGEHSQEKTDDKTTEPLPKEDEDQTDHSGTSREADRQDD